VYQCSTGGFLCVEFLDYLAGVRETARFVFREHQLVIDDDIEDTVAAGDQFGIYSEGIAQFIRQTGGVWFIVSLLAVTNFDLHNTPPGKYVHKAQQYMYDRIIQLSISADKAALTGMIARRRNINDVNIKYVLLVETYEGVKPWPGRRFRIIFPTI
jgi:hypothetical protein